MTSRKYILCAVSSLYVFMLFSLALWHSTVIHTFIGRDLVRMGSISTAEPLTEDRHYSEHHTEFADYIASGIRESFDVLTIGDSFTNGRDGSSYPDYLVNQYGLKILNVRLSIDDCITTLYMLSDSGWLDEISPRAVILESVERSVQKRFGQRVLESFSVTKEHITDFLPKTKAAVNLSAGFMPPIMIQADLNYLYNKLYHLCKPGQLSSEVYITKLDCKLFTNPGQENTLLHYYEDLEYLTQPLNAEMVNQNLNNAASLLNAKGIKMIFFAAPDKYDLYSPYILDKKGRPENLFFRKMRGVSGKKYVFADAMTPLSEALERGEKDVYWLHDTHWSHKGIKIFCDELVNYILPESR